MKFTIAATLVASATAFAPVAFRAGVSTQLQWGGNQWTPGGNSAPAPAPASVGPGHIGTGGMADTRDPAAFTHEDPRKSISAAPTFEEYMKSRSGTAREGHPTVAAPAPAAAAPAPAAGGSLFDQYMAGRSSTAREGHPSVAAPAPATPSYSAPAAPASVGPGHIGTGGMADTRDPAAFTHEDPRKSISAAPTFEEYMKSRSGTAREGHPSVAAPAPVAAAPAPAAGGSLFDSYMAGRSSTAREGHPSVAAPASVGPGHIGTGGMADTRDPAAFNHEDPRKSISAAPTFEEYMKSRGQ